jgi:enoyl-CoA hydratase/carnithine racemase
VDDLQEIRFTRPVDGVGLAVLDRPARLNALTPRMFDELVEVCRAVDADAGIRVLVITGAGRGFCSGLDLDAAEALPSLSPETFLRRQERWAAAVAGLRTMATPVIAAVNGAAAGAGFALALAADIRVASPAARFNAAFVRIGLSGGDLGTSWMLPRIVGLGRAYEILLTGSFVAAEEALRIGLVNRVVPDEELLAASYELAQAIAANSPFGIALTKKVVQANVDAPSLHAAIELENRNQVLASRSTDMAEALAAFREGRAPDFG